MPLTAKALADRAHTYYHRRGVLKDIKMTKTSKTASVPAVGQPTRSAHLPQSRASPQMRFKSAHLARGRV